MLRIIGATLRLTRLVTTDTLGRWYIADPIDRAMERYEAREVARAEREGREVREPWWWKMRDGLDCPFCVGFWLGLGILVIEATALGRSRTWRTLTGALALNYLTGHLSARLEADHDDDHDH